MSVAVTPGLHRGRLAVGLVIGIGVFAFEAMAVLTAMPSVADELSGDRLYGAAFSAYSLANLVSLVVTGEQSDRRGPFVPFVRALVVFVVGLLVAGFAPSMPVVVVGRALQGFGAGAIASVAYVAVARVWEPARQPTMFAWLSAGWVVPSLVAPALAGVVTETLGWRWVFLGLIPLFPFLLVLAGPSLRRLPAPEEIARGPSRLPDALRLAAGTGLIVAGLQTGWVLAGLVVAALGAALAWPAAKALLPPGTWRAAAGIGGCVAARFAVNLSFFGTDSFLPLAADRIHGATPIVAGGILVSASLTWTGGAAWAARSALGSAAKIRLAFAMLAASIAATIPIVLPGWPLALVAVSWAVAGFGIGVVFNTTSAVAMAAAEAGREGKVSSQLQIADTLGFALAAGVGGALVGVADRTAIRLAPMLVLELGLAAVVSVIGAVVAARAASRPAPALAA
jgi:MFS family permease